MKQLIKNPLALIAGVVFMCSSAGCGGGGLSLDDAGVGIPGDGSDHDGEIPCQVPIYCADIREAIMGRLANPAGRVCTSNYDCVPSGVAEICGIPNSGRAETRNRSFASDTCWRLLRETWLDFCTPPEMCNDYPGGSPGSCHQGVCGVETEQEGIGDGDIGDACKSAGDCASGQCVSAPAEKGFSSGYCTVRDCSKIGCPPGSTCLWENGRSYCFAECDTVSARIVSQCRPGYPCCGNYGKGACVPSDNPLCP